jgi:hypothetical protein
MSDDTVEVEREELSTILEYVAMEAASYSGVPDDVDEAAQNLEEVALSTPPLSESELGWYIIEEEWNLWLDGGLEEREVYAINVDEVAEGVDEVKGEDYVVKHFDRRGELITTERLTDNDIAPEIEERETVSHPFSA